MKKLVKLLSLISISSLQLTSCVDMNMTKTYQISDYRLEMDFGSDDTFNLMLLSDMHFSVIMDVKQQKDHLNKMIDDAKAKDESIDLIVLDGDNFVDANKEVVDLFVETFDLLNIPYAVTFGNHDQQGDYDHYYFQDLLNESDNAMFIDYEDDDLYGYANYYINLNDGDETVYRIYIVDSNSYYPDSGITYSYDVIHDEQIDHINKIAEFEDGDVAKEDHVPGLTFFHIPVYEYEDAIADYRLCDPNDMESCSSPGQHDNNEGIGYGYKKTNMYDTLLGVNNKAIFVGHDHINFSDIFYKKEMILSYALKSSNLVYHEDDLIGYKMIHLPRNADEFTYQDIELRKVAYDD